MRIRLENVEASPVEATHEERSWLRGYLTFPEAGGRFSGRDETCVCNPLTDAFPAGFLPLVVKAAERAAPRRRVEVEDVRPHPPARDPGADLGWLRPHQVEAFERAVARTRGLVHHVTAGGKTEQVVAFARAFPRARVLFVAPQLDLARQTAERWVLRSTELGGPVEPPGVVGGGSWSEGRLTCATLQTLSLALRRGDERGRALCAGADVLIVDEAHALPAATFAVVPRACPRAYYRVGLSATPLDRSDRRSREAIGALGPVIHRARADELAESGDVARALVRAVECRQPWTGPWEEAYARLVVDSAVRNALVVEMVLRAPKPCFCFARVVEHGERLRDLLRRAGLRVALVDGDVPVRRARRGASRETLRADLAEGRLDALVVTAVGQQGWNLPELRSVVCAGGGASKIGAVQRIGRGMRVVRDGAGNVLKGSFEVWDVLDLGQEHLERHARRRVAAYRSEGHSVSVLASLPPRGAPKFSCQTAPP